MNLISIASALEKIISEVNIGEVVSQQLIDSNNNYLAETIISPIDLPGFNNSAMDGYVFRMEDYENGTRNFIQTLEVKAGDVIPTELLKNQCYRIFTGAPVPANGTLVIMQEHIKNAGDQITIEEEGSAFFQNIRSQGEQIKKGEIALQKGEKLTPAAIGYLASLGLSKVKTYTKPKVSILTTGNELIEAGKPLESGKIYESNAIALASAFRNEGVQPSIISGIPDNYSATLIAIEEQIQKNDFIVLTGGISVGDYDFVGKALDELKVETLFYKVNQKPGKPFFFGKKGHCSIFALPGNPAAAMTCFYYYLRPAIQKFVGARYPKIRPLRLPLSSSFQVKGSRELLLKSKIENGKIEILDGQSSNMMHTFALANAITQIPADKKQYEAGELVSVFPF
ncbi:molybdopterin molybdotransferase MoeA [Salibacteraceae bacterium]|jgi:molybdopterin molybdotransferase|nr:molybdopterin molybdotransferase MoeA [Bacteroidota bacterium]MDB9725031.1 molybdopterin molybdotransferase MoeA [Salibacteraceae bacterium]